MSRINPPPAFPLPTGASTSANQSTEIASLSTIATQATASATSASAINTALGTDSTGITQLTGGAGIRGWLSGCFSKLASVVTNTGTIATTLGSTTPPTFANLPESRARSGQAFIATTGIQTFTALAGNFNITIANPAASGKTVYLDLMIFDSAYTSLVIGSVFANPTTGLPGTTVTQLSTLIGGTAGVAVIKYNVSGTALSGGSLMRSLTILPTAPTTVSSRLIVIPANNLIGITLPVVAVATAGMAMYFWEE